MPPWVRLPTRPGTVVSDVPPPVTCRLACFAAGCAAEAEAEASPAAGASIRPAAVAMAAIRRIARMGISLLAALARRLFAQILPVMERIFWHAGERRKAAAEVSQNPADRARAAGEAGRARRARSTWPCGALVPGQVPAAGRRISAPDGLTSGIRVTEGAASNEGVLKWHSF